MKEQTVYTEIKGQIQLSELPPNVLQMIFLHLDLPSKKNVVLVSKKWRDLAYDKIIWKNIFVNVDLKRIANRQIFVSFETRGIRLIDVNNLSKTATKLIAMFRNVPSLRELKIVAYWRVLDKNLYLLHKFSNHRALELRHAHKITDQVLKVVGNNLKELTTLRLWSCILITDVGINYLTGTDDKNGIQGCFKLKHLCLQNCPEITDGSLKMIATKLMELTKLELQYCNRITDTGITFLIGGTRFDDIPGNRKLEELDLSAVSGISDLCFQNIARGLPVLHSLNISGNRALTGLAFAYLANMPTLTILERTNCGVMGDWLLPLVRSKIRNKYLSYNNGISTEGLQHISCMSHLRELYLTNCGVDDEGLECLSRCPSKLVALDLYDNNKITDASIVHLAKLVHLKVLDLSKCPHITSVGALQLAQLAPENLKLEFKHNFSRVLECIHQIIRKVEDSSFGSVEWQEAIRKINQTDNIIETC